MSSLLSTHKVEVIPVVLERHPNADSLSLVRFEGYTCVVRTEDWKDVSLAAYIPPDSVVPDLPEYAFLNGHLRIKARKFRGVWSQGLLMPAPAGSKIGDDVAEQLGVTHHEPPVKGFQSEVYKSPYRVRSWRGRLLNPLYKWLYAKACEGRTEKGPNVVAPKYDVDSWRRYKNLFTTGEEVVITEKIHGANAKYTFEGGKLYVGSRTEWKREPRTLTIPWWVRASLWLLRMSAPSDHLQPNLWWTAIRKYPDVIAWLQRNEGCVLYGEVYGQVQDLRYGAEGPNDVWFRAFDVLEDGKWWNYDRLQLTRLPLVPELYRGPYDEALIEKLAEGKTTLLPANKAHVREGCVVRPVVEREAHPIGRVQLKCVGNGYLERE